MSLLITKNLGIDFGGLTAVNNFNFEINDGEIVGLIGPNGAGKTTVFNLLTKVYKPTRGSITLKDKDITSLSTIEVNKLGIARTFQNIRLFSNMSVIENVLTAFHNFIDYSLFSSILKLPKYSREEERVYNEAIELLHIFGLDSKKDEIASNLSYGEQRKLEIVRALATKPCLLLLDEPAAGMNPSETSELMNTIKFIRDKFNISILLIEHDMNLVMNVCERIYVLNFGMMLVQGKPEDIKNNKDVIKAYLGD